ncbi:MAG: hypothetical protein K2L02_01080, partial [Clostridia bacterium]|nr:hypothetical protein [Clostridia bacterium]
MWDSTNQHFDYAVVKDLKEKLFGSASANAVSYIKDPDNYDAQEMAWTNSYVVNASKINASYNNYGLIVKLGGLDWMVTSMTLADGDKPVITLYLADDLMNSANTARVTSQYYSDYRDIKGNNMYSRSILRNNINSRSGNYEKLKLFDKSTGVTNKNADFEADFLVQPKYIAYQRQQTLKGRAEPWVTDNAPNEALETPTNGTWQANLVANPYLPGDVIGGVRYDAWGDDYIWVPSMSETGTNDRLIGKTIWKLSDEQRVHSQNYCWLRSGSCDSYYYVFRIASGGSYLGDRPDNSYGVRPALHLDLDAIVKNAPIPAPESEKEDAKKGEGYKTTYNGEEQTLAKEAWYRADIFDNTSCIVTYTDVNGDTVDPKDAGEYTATITLNGGYVWADATSATDDTRTVKFTIEKKPLKVNFAVDSTTKVPALSVIGSPFDGDTVNGRIRYFDMTGKDLGTDASVLKAKTQYKARAEFDDPNYEPDNAVELTFTNPATRVKANWRSQSEDYNGAKQSFILTINGGSATATLKTGYGEDVTQDNNQKFSAVNAGVYEVVLSLADKNEYVWDSTGKSDDITMSFEIKPIKKTISLQNYSSSWSVTAGKTTTATLVLPALVSGNMGIYVSADCFGYSENIALVNLGSSSSVQTVTLDTSDLPADVYNLGIAYQNPNDSNAKNYVFEFNQTYSFTVKRPTSTGGLDWFLMSESKFVNSQSDPDASNSLIYTKKITYSGKSYYFEINALGIGYQVDTGYNDNDFTNGYKTVKKGDSTALTSVTDAGTYITYAHLTGSDGAEDYSIEWTIDKALIDLSNVRWLPKDGKVAFSDRMSIIIDPDTLPEGLKVKRYDDSHSVTEFGQEGTATVVFELTDSNNYVLPENGDTDTYIFKANGGLDGFEWSKDWEVVSAVIPVNWTVSTITISGNKKVNVKSLEGGYDLYLDYVYYESDSRGNVAADAVAISESDLKFIDGTIKYYVAEVSIKSNLEGKYVFENGKATNRSTVFEVGHTLTEVHLASQKTEYVYWGKEINFQFRVTEGAITTDAFEITYYKGDIRQNNVPKDVGRYTAQISLKSEYTNDYYIEGISSFAYTINSATIAINWKTETKPPVLKITQEQKTYVSYEYIDNAGNAIAFGDLSEGTYRVRAVINSAGTRNYIFDNNLTYTDWVSFTVAPGEELVNPEDSSLYLPSTDPNAPNSSADDGTVRFYLASIA